MGFQNLTIDASVLSHASINQNNISNCAQLCTIRSSHMAVLNDTCTCFLSVHYASINTISDAFNCTSEILCPGNSGQICGCDGKSAVYKLEGVLSNLSCLFLQNKLQFMKIATPIYARQQ